ncbi:MAG: hypothetical protein H0W68_09755 [Gemmatimonadaceae bacterium]|nr:hypothetical protein [Gemmatimonadaceae bacterium]
MRTARLNEMFRGWFVGDFEPTLYRTSDVEVAVQEYEGGVRHDVHHHRIATELTVIVSGEVEMNGQRFGPGDIVVIEPNEATDFRTLTPATTVVVKLPGASNDKYPGGA